MLVSSYIDSVISNELEQFKEEHSEIFLKNGDLKAEYRNADEVIKQIYQDDFFIKYLNRRTSKSYGRRNKWSSCKNKGRFLS